MTFQAERSVIHQSTSRRTQGDASASGDAISRRQSESASAFSIAPHTDGVTANPVLRSGWSKNILTGNGEVTTSGCSKPDVPTSR